MNFETISRFHFEPIEKRAQSSQETIRVTESRVTMTNSLYERMGSPEFLMFGFDSENKAVGVKVEDQIGMNVVEVKKNQKVPPMLLNSKFIANYIRSAMEIEDKDQVILLTRGSKVNDWYVFELRNADIQKKIIRRVKK